MTRWAHAARRATVRAVPSPPNFHARVAAAASGALFAVAGLASCGDTREAACAAASAASSAPPVSVGAPTVDADRDGLDDALEGALARAYLPFLAQHPEDECPRSGLVFRARPHPEDARLVAVTYSFVYELDCGLNGHAGDNEGFGIAIDPSVPPPAGLVSMTAVGHQGTACERTTTCGVCDGLPACEVEGRAVLFASRNKHAGSVSRTWGCGVGSCLDECALPVLPADPPMVNAGEPGAPLLGDLTREGFITAARGWRDASLFHADPWSDDVFGRAGVIGGDLLDEVFVAPACTCEARDE